jgi:hypothetical protein
MVFTWTDGHTPLWITPKSGERGTGNREPETWGHPCPGGKGGNREPGTRQRRAGRGTGNLGTPVAVKKGGNRSYECRVQSAECGIRYYKSGTEGRGHEGTGGRGAMETAKTADGGRDSGCGGREPAFVPASRNYGGQAGNRIPYPIPGTHEGRSPGDRPSIMHVLFGRLTPCGPVRPPRTRPVATRTVLGDGGGAEGPGRPGPQTPSWPARA